MKKCDICGKEFNGYGNNPAPLKGKVCCDECNLKYVLPTRLGIKVKVEKNYEKK